MIVSQSMQSPVHYQPEQLLLRRHVLPLRVRARYPGADVNVADNRPATTLPSEAK